MSLGESPTQPSAVLRRLSGTLRRWGRAALVRKPIRCGTDTSGTGLAGAWCSYASGTRETPAGPTGALASCRTCLLMSYSSHIARQGARPTLEAKTDLRQVGLGSAHRGGEAGPTPPTLDGSSGVGGVLAAAKALGHGKENAPRL